MKKWLSVVLAMLLVVSMMPIQKAHAQNNTKAITFSVITNANIGIGLRDSYDPNDNQAGYSYLSDGNGFVEAGQNFSQAVTIFTDRDLYLTIEPELFQSNNYDYIKVNGQSMQNVINGTGRNVFQLDLSSINDTLEVEVACVQAQSYNIMWANSGAVNLEGTDFDESTQLEHGKAFVRAVYNNATEMQEISSNFSDLERGYVDNDGKGYIPIEAGNVVEFEFIPDYGYQLATVYGANNTEQGRALNAQEEVNRYYLEMPEGNVHFKATFVRTEDAVNTTATAVKGGSIALQEGEIDAGSALLNISDVESISGEQREAFEQTAGDFEVKEILDIHLQQIFHKANTESDMWAYGMEQLDREATVTLELDEGIAGEEYVVLHETHNSEGEVTGYQVIEPQYHPGNHSLSFETKSFSNYAIATKGDTSKDNTEKDNSNEAGQETAINASVEVSDLDQLLAKLQLTPEQLEALKETPPEVTIDVKPLNDTMLDATKKEEIQKILQGISTGVNLGAYFDITLTLTIHDKNGNVVGDPYQISEPGIVKVSLECPKELISTNANMIRKFYIIREHNGVYTTIPAQLDNGNIVFETNQFSLYALAYEDVPATVVPTTAATAATTAATTAAGEAKSPKTSSEPMERGVLMIATRDAIAKRKKEFFK